jgi:biopolymer transport protein ExbD
MKLKRRNKANPDFSLAAMVDVILLLLIFFMVTSSAATQSAIDVKLPKADATVSTLKDPATVTITEVGKYYVNDKEIPKDNLESYLVNTLKAESTPSFTIRADGNTKHKDVVFLMEIAEKHKYNLAIATTQEK